MSEYRNEFLHLVGEREESFVMVELERTSAAQGNIPPDPDLLSRRFRVTLTIAGAVLLGCLSGVMVVIVNFILFVRLLHLEW